MQVWAVSLLTTGASPPESNCLELDCWYSEFDRNDEVSPYSFLPVLYPQQVIQTLTLKLFRREPAITKFDQLFTAYHKSSDEVERSTGSGLPSSFDEVHPAHGKITWLRVLNMQLADLSQNKLLLRFLNFNRNLQKIIQQYYILLHNFLLRFVLKFRNLVTNLLCERSDFALLTLAFAVPPYYRNQAATYSDSLAHSSIGTPQRSHYATLRSTEIFNF